MTTFPDAEAALERYFGFSAFRLGQDEIVDAILLGRDVLAIMPTGGGKSLCYQLPSLLLEGTTIVVSPLIALMKDQVDALQARGIEATMINSTLSAKEQGERIRAMAAGKYKLVYVAPERFRHRYFLEHFRNVKVSFFAVDEAHCVSQWGHDFRPDYLRIGEGIKAAGRPPVGAFTATATREVRDDISRSLGLTDPAIFIRGFARPNLEFRVSHAAKKADKLARLSAIIGEHKKGIIYCATRKRVEEVAEYLLEWDISHIAYHAGLDDAEREQRQDTFIRGGVDVAVATNAFGMGIDRADMRFVVHFEIPGSVEAYYQEAGRAGRDGMPSLCELFYNYADRKTQDFFIEGRNPPVSFMREVYGLLLAMADAEGAVHRSIQEITDALAGGNSMMVGTALKHLVSVGAIERFDVPGARKRGTRLVDRSKAGPDLVFDEAALAEKARRDEAKLEAILTYAGLRGCRQEWIQQFFGEADAQPCLSCDFCRSTDPSRLKPLSQAQMLVLQKMLSGVARMSGRSAHEGWVPRFGINMITKMLTGSEERRISELGLHQLSTYGLLKGEGMPFVRTLIEECLRCGLIRSTGGSLPMITLTPMGEAAMRGQLTQRMLWPSEGTGSPPQMGAPLKLESLPNEAELLEEMKRKRAQLARIRGNVPPYRIFSNRVLEDLARYRPRSAEEALSIPGIGEKKARSLIKPFLEIIGRYR